LGMRDIIAKSFIEKNPPFFILCLPFRRYFVPPLYQKNTKKQYNI